MGLVLLMGVAGCSNPGTPRESSEVKTSATALASASPNLPVDPTTGSDPSTSPPSDLITGFWLLGSITRGGPGPCYGFRTDGGREYALSGATIGPLAIGDRIRARIKTTEQPVDCGPGEVGILLEIKRAG
jgi:hypothetical protein